MRFLRIVVVSVLGFTLLVGISNSSFAATNGLPSFGESKASIELLAGTGPVSPVDPNNPAVLLDRTDQTNPTNPATGNSGSLTLDFVSSVDFGVHQITSNTEIFSSKSNKPFIQVSDLRGTSSGWIVTAIASEFSSEGGKTATLKGAIITFENGEVLSATPKVPPTPVKTITLNADGLAASKVVSSKVGTGEFTWVTRWFTRPDKNNNRLNHNVSLMIPAGSASVGNHQATITWTLTDAPGN